MDPRGGVPLPVTPPEEQKSGERQPVGVNRDNPYPRYASRRSTEGLQAPPEHLRVPADVGMIGPDELPAVLPV